MRNENTMSRSDYVFDTVAAMGIAQIWYLSLLLRGLPGLGWRRSLTVYIVLVAGGCIAGTALTWKRGRNMRNVLVNTLGPFGLYTAAAYAHDRPVFVIAALSAAALLTAFCAWAVFSRRIRHPEKRRMIVRRRAVRTAMKARAVLTWCLMALAAALVIDKAFTVTTNRSPAAEAIAKDSAVWEMVPEISEKQEREMLARFSQDVWPSLTRSEKLKALQTVVDMESVWLGLPTRLTVDTMTEARATVIASYRDETREIYFAESYLDSMDGRRLLQSAIHEARHAYQHRVVQVYREADPALKDLLLLQEGAVFDEELTHYVNGSTDVREYLDQLVEQDANEYASQRREWYERRIDSYRQEETD